jgi:dipeptidase D
VTADGTTLGADNGVGVALALAVAESTTDRVPLELLITVDEERGLAGAFGCDPAIVQGRRIINLDSEEDGVFIIGCAGGTDWTVSFAKSANDRRSGDCWRCCLGGFRGGHSGVDIDKGRVNAIRTAAAVVEALAAAHPELQVTGFAGGNAMNAIPRECRFTVAGCAPDDVEAAAAPVLATIRHAEPGAAMTVEPAAAASHEIPVAVVSFMSGVADGVLAMDPVYTEQVQTSSNLGVVTEAADSIAMKVMGRSTVYAEQQRIGRQIEQAAAGLGGAMATGSDFPGWAPKPDSSLLQLGLAAYREQFDAAPRIESIHAGLECGIIGAALGTDELLSLGPSIDNAHSPDERVNIAGVERVYRLLKALVTRRQ